MSTHLDDQAQQRISVFNAARRRERAIHEMLGLVKGVIIDGEVTESEAQFLASWIRANPEAVHSWPGLALAKRLMKIFADGRIDPEEREDLMFFLQDLAGGVHADGDIKVAVRLPLNEPMPPLLFSGIECVFMGHFIWGTTSNCEAAVIARGGTCGRNVTRRTGILIIGDLGSHDWVHSSFARKIQKAVEYRAKGLPLVIVDEEHWANCL